MKKLTNSPREYQRQRFTFQSTSRSMDRKHIGDYSFEKNNINTNAISQLKYCMVKFLQGPMRKANQRTVKLEAVRHHYRSDNRTSSKEGISA